jgi:phosphoribosylformylglycinamidine synthase
MEIIFFKTPQESIIATQAAQALSAEDVNKLCWLYGEATALKEQSLTGYFIGPRREMVTPWSTNAVEITQNMNIQGIRRIEEYFPVASKDADYDPMLQRLYEGLNQDIFTVNIQPAPIRMIENLEA